jgi:hypothetical protein
MNIAGTATSLSTASGSAPSYSARAWVNFNGSGSVSTNQTINASANVSTVFKNGTGNYTVNFSTAMSDANFSVSTGVGNAIADAIQGATRVGAYATGSIALGCVNPGGTVFTDSSRISVMVVR